jgi:uncharacterized phage protein gp47/JayE
VSELTAEGLVIETFVEIRAGINAELREEYGPEADLSDGAVAGIFVAAVARSDADREELTEAVNSSSNPDTATGARLDSICAITGTIREAATPSSVVLTLTGDDATIVLAGNQASIEATGARFATLEDVTLAALDAWTITTPYVIGDRVTNDGKAYLCTDPGTSAGAGGPDTEDEAITDGSVIWRFLGEGEAAADVDSECTVTGPTVGTTGTILEIETPVSGWISVINILDADVGTLLESDEALRMRRETELSRPGTSTQDAIRADILEVDGVTTVTVFANREDIEVDGIPAHSVEVLVQGGEDQDIWDKLWLSIPVEADTVGDEEGTVVDSQGTSHTLRFSRPDELEIYVEVELSKDPLTYPDDGDDQVIAAIVAFGDAQLTGRDVRASAISAAIFAAVDGILDVTAVFIGIAPAPALSTTIAVSLRQLALYDTSRIGVTSVDEVP